MNFRTVGGPWGKGFGRGALQPLVLRWAKRRHLPKRGETPPLRIGYLAGVRLAANSVPFAIAAAEAPGGEDRRCPSVPSRWGDLHALRPAPAFRSLLPPLCSGYLPPFRLQRGAPVPAPPQSARVPPPGPWRLLLGRRGPGSAAGPRAAPSPPPPGHFLSASRRRSGGRGGEQRRPSWPWRPARPSPPPATSAGAGGGARSRLRRARGLAGWLAGEARLVVRRPSSGREGAGQQPASRRDGASEFAAKLCTGGGGGGCSGRAKGATLERPQQDSPGASPAPPTPRPARSGRPAPCKMSGRPGGASSSRRCRSSRAR